MDYLAFSHSQTQSKIWLCEQLEPLLPKRNTVAILGAWYNLLGFMMLTRKPNYYQCILGVDVDPSVKEIADKLCQGWMICDTCYIKNVTADANHLFYQGYNVVINCSVEHMNDSGWFDNIMPGTLVCLQSSDVVESNDVWKVINPNRSLEELQNKYPLSHTLFLGEKPIQYENWGFKRLMLIGVK